MKAGTVFDELNGPHGLKLGAGKVLVHNAHELVVTCEGYEYTVLASGIWIMRKESVVVKKHPSFYG